ncbi:serine threonine protein kinase [Ophiostoma piceae UAMH 11346]|uniref:Serine threonine protein kinase n=1 Tax=Ophiostoma piceae (strain UAMH 11346) TaxID=1262450 RepID=S3BW38_OPHP1|nr:serine threonine protein kinase [Ophiostoma piceae UAMH 11346]
MSAEDNSLVLELTPEVKVENGVHPKARINRMKEASTYSRSIQFFVGIQYKNVSHIEIQCKTRRKHRLGIFIGPSPKYCDIVVHDRSKSETITPVWGLITYDKKNRLIYRDVRHPVDDLDPASEEGSSVGIYDHAERETRRGFTWVLSGCAFLASKKRVLKLHLNEFIMLKLDVPNYDRHTQEHLDRVQHFLHAPVIYETGNPDTADLEAALCLDPKDLQAGIRLTCDHKARHEITLKKKLKSGAHGVVWRVYNVSTGECWAEKTPLELSNTRYITDEIRWYEEIKKSQQSRDYSRYIIKYIFGETTPVPRLRLEYATHGSLKDEKKKREMSILESADALEQVLKATSFLHSITMAHRDIKPDNVLVKYRSPKYQKRGDISIRLADFGLSKSGNLKTNHIGTFTYMAPELFKDKPYSHAVDIWATGVMFFHIHFGLPDYIKSQQASKAKHELKPVGLKMCANIEEVIDSATNCAGSDAILASFIREHMVQGDASKRLSADDCLKKHAELYTQCQLIASPDLAVSTKSQPPIDSQVGVRGSISSSSTQTVESSNSYGYGNASRSNVIAHASGAIAHETRMIPSQTQNSYTRSSNDKSINMPSIKSSYVIPASDTTDETFQMVQLEQAEDSAYDSTTEVENGSYILLRAG